MAQETRQVNGKLIEINGSVCDVQSTPVHGVRVQSSFSQNKILSRTGVYILSNQGESVNVHFGLTLI